MAYIFTCNVATKEVAYYDIINNVHKYDMNIYISITPIHG
jgi:hypothetical protein